MGGQIADPTSKAMAVIEAIDALMLFNPAMLAARAVVVGAAAGCTLALQTIGTGRAVAIVVATRHADTLFADIAQRAIRILLATLDALVGLSIANLTDGAIAIVLAAGHALIGAEIAIASRRAGDIFVAASGALAVQANQPLSQALAIVVVIASVDTDVVYANLSGRTIQILLAPGSAAVIDAFLALLALIVFVALHTDAQIGIAERKQPRTIIVAGAGAGAEAIDAIQSLRTISIAQTLHALAGIATGKVAKQPVGAVPFAVASFDAFLIYANRSDRAIAVYGALWSRLTLAIYAHVTVAVRIVQAFYALASLQVAIRGRRRTVVIVIATGNTAVFVAYLAGRAVVI